jgi:hypothetical protein
MIITAGDKVRFAIESEITKAYERLSFVALGYFVIFVAGHRYGVLKPDASMLACSVGTVEDRILERGTHTAPFASDPNAGLIANAYRDAIFAPNQDEEVFFGIPQPQFRDLIYDNRIVWAPDGDEAFDDWSHVLQFDVGERVRLIAFTSNEEGYHHNPSTLRDLWLEADEFYGILQQWREAFKKAWAAAPKIPEAEDGAE